MEDLFLETKDQLKLYNKNKNKNNKSKVFHVKKARVFNILAKIEKVVQETTICNEWENNALYYLNKLWDSKSTTKTQNKNHTISSNMTNQINRNSDDLIVIKIESRYLEGTKYFLVNVKSKRDKVIDYGSPRGTNNLTNLSLFAGAQSSGKLSIEKFKNIKPLDTIRNNSSYNVSAINGGNNFYMADPIPSPTTSKPMNSTLNVLDLNQSINNSKETLFLGNFQGNANKIKRQKSYFTHINEDEAFLNIHTLNFQLKRTKKNINYIRITIILIYCCLFFIIILNFTICHKLFTNTLKIIERLYSKKKINKHFFQLVGITSLFISSKYEEIYYPDIKDWVEITGGKYTEDQILKMEDLIVGSLDFHLLPIYPYAFYEIICLKLGIEKEDFFLGALILEIALFDYALVKYKSSTICESVIIMLMKIVKRKKEKRGLETIDLDNWLKMGFGNFIDTNPKHVKKITECNSIICTLMDNIENCLFRKVVEKYSRKEYCCVTNFAKVTQ